MVEVEGTFNRKLFRNRSLPAETHNAQNYVGNTARQVEYSHHKDAQDVSAHDMTCLTSVSRSLTALT